MASSSSFMASSSSLPRTWEYDVFTSFHGPDVRKTFLSHLRKQFEDNAITMFNDEKIERGATIAPALKEAIRESMISFIVLSKKFASSSWCLDELLEIMKCKEDLGQIVMTIFYGVDPSDVRKQTGEFGDAFKDTCAKNTDEKISEWSKALTDASNIAGEDFTKCNNEAEIIEKIARYVSIRLHATPSTDSDIMVGLEAHLRKMESLLEFDNDEAKIIAISGPAGIGKTTIATALYNQLSNSFRHCGSMDLRTSYDEEKLLSKLLNLNGISEFYPGLIKKRLRHRKVLILLDDAHSLKQLEALADIRCYGPGTRIIVTTENKEILEQHGINDIYHVTFPSEDEALMIFSLSAFEKTSPPDEFLNLANEVVRICGNLPLCLKVVGSSLRRKNLDAWELQLPRLRNSLDRDIKDVLQFGYESLHEKDQVMFLCIAVFFSGERYDDVISKLDEPNWNARLGLKILTNRYLIQHVDGRVEMHHLLRLMARQVISNEDMSKRKILIDPHNIRNVLEKATGNESVVGISFDITETKKLIINNKAFDNMFNLLFLKVHDGSVTNELEEMIRGFLFKKGYKRETEMHIPEDIKFPDHLRVVHWEYYPRKNLPPGFCTENLVKLDLRYSLLEKLWKGIQPLPNLKEIDVSFSIRLKKLPDLSTATNLEILNVDHCSALVEIPSSVANLRRLRELMMNFCESLEIIPTLANLTSLKGYINLNACSKLRTFPDFPTNTSSINLYDTGVKEMPASLRHCSSLKYLEMSGSRNLRTFSTQLPTGIRELDLHNSGIKNITDCIKCLPYLKNLNLSRCKRLVSLPELPSSLHFLRAENCKSLKRVSGPLNTPIADLHFTNCFKLDLQARRAIIQQSYFLVTEWAGGQSGWGVLPGRQIPEEFVHRTTRNSLTIPPSTFNRVKGCIVISPKLLQDICSVTRCDEYEHIYFDFKINGSLVRSIVIYYYIEKIQAEHLLIFCSDFLSFAHSTMSTNIVLECRVRLADDDHDEEKFINYPLDIIEWGIQILTDNKDRSNNGGSSSLECSSLTGITEGGDYKFVSRKHPRKTMIASVTTSLKRVIQRLFSKKKEK